MQRWWIAGPVGLLVAAGAAVAPTAHARVPQTSTALLLSTPESAYGQPVTATATVSAPGGPAEGDVVFSVDDRQFKANLNGGGSASIVLPPALVGTRPVSATFLPQFPDRQEASSATQTWTVLQVRTRLQVRVIGKGVRIPTSVQVKAAGEYGTLPTGRVRLELRRTRSGDTVRLGRRLGSTGVALVDLGRLRRGRYRLVTTFLGDSQHLLERQFTRFRVQQR